uniref:Uncharacterized protein n=1 Tax=Derbesia sp. WEST4838 TaxID=1847751 RepID=A0A1C9JBG1_9CHLO|nr:hypothetical protein [Derbesia sp. WEST4838]AOP19182.1 hypothetical protein [Derbesia sp. WEST4838]
MSTNEYYVAWDKIDWIKVQQRVRRIQNRIFKAKLVQDKYKLYGLQKRLIHSLDAKALALKRVIAQSYKVKIISDDQKLALIHQLKIDSKISPIARLDYIKCSQYEEKRLNLVSLIDQSKQELIKLVLEAEWSISNNSYISEFIFDRKIREVLADLSSLIGNRKAKFVWVGDPHPWLSEMNYTRFLEILDIFPRLKNQIKNWLVAGLLYKYTNLNKEFFFPKVYSSFRSGLAPLIIKIFLKSLESHLNLVVFRNTEKIGNAIRHPIQLITVEDNFLIIHENKQILNWCIQYTKNWLLQFGVKLNLDKVKIQDTTQGFEFLEFQVVQIKKYNKFLVRIRPSKLNQEKMLTQIRNIIQTNKSSSSYILIQKLRPIILGWGNYFKFCDCKIIYNRLSHQIFLKLRAWVFRRDTRSSRTKIKQKYFPENRIWRFNNKSHQDNWVLYGKTKNKSGNIRENFLPHLRWIQSEKSTYSPKNKLK